MLGRLRPMVQSPIALIHQSKIADLQSIINGAISKSSIHFILYASATGLNGRSNHVGRRVPSGPGAGRVFAIHSL